MDWHLACIVYVAASAANRHISFYWIGFGSLTKHNSHKILLEIQLLSASVLLISYLMQQLSHWFAEILRSKSLYANYSKQTINSHLGFLFSCKNLRRHGVKSSTSLDIAKQRTRPKQWPRLYLTLLALLPIVKSTACQAFYSRVYQTERCKLIFSPENLKEADPDIKLDRGGCRYHIRWGRNFDLTGQIKSPFSKMCF